nr:MAG TPA: hypothetical protein [Bacteriophage sp.]
MVGNQGARRVKNSFIRTGGNEYANGSTRCTTGSTPWRG